MDIRTHIPKNGLLLAPMEGVTDGTYRQTIQNLFPEWDLFSTDFLRCPKGSTFTEKKIMDHFGKEVFQSKDQKQKTSYQILTSVDSNTVETVRTINSLGFHHLDLNLGCPSKKVNSHKGGAYLLSDLNILEKIIHQIRQTFTGLFTVKIRIGYRDDSLFEDSLKLFEANGVDAITIHGRTRDQLYKGKASWDHIKRASQIVDIPIIGNGDIWTLQDIDDIFVKTNCHAVMLGRSAMKTPWIAGLYKEYKKTGLIPDDEFLLYERKKYLDIYFSELSERYLARGVEESKIHSRFKSLSHHLFEDYHNFEELRSYFLRSRSLEEFIGHLDRLP